MSGSASLVKIDKHVKIVLTNNFNSIGGGLHVDFDLQLSRRGGDFKVYASTGYTQNTSDTDLLAAILNAIMTVRSGVEWVSVRSFSLEINNNRASNADDIMKQLQYAATRAGYAVEFVDLSRR